METLLAAVFGLGFVACLYFAIGALRRARRQRPKRRVFELRSMDQVLQSINSSGQEEHLRDFLRWSLAALVCLVIGVWLGLR